LELAWEEQVGKHCEEAESKWRRRRAEESEEV